MSIKKFRMAFSIVKGFFYSYILFRKYYNKKIFLCNRGMGDTLLFCALLPAYHNRNSDKKIVVVIAERQKFIAQAYSECIDTIVAVKNQVLTNLNNAADHSCINKKMTYIIPPGAIHYLGYKNINIIDLQRITLNLPEDSAISIPEFSLVQESDSVNKIMNCYGLKEKEFIILAPAAKTVNMLGYDIWEKAAAYYIRHGYKVITNLKDKQEMPIKNTIGLCLTLPEIFLLSQYAEEFVSIRSGLCDLIVFSDCNMTVIYPTDGELSNSREWKQYNYKSWGLLEKIKEINSVEFKNIYEL